MPVLHAQQLMKFTLTWSDASKDGFEFKVPFRCKFTNCGGEASLAITLDKKQAQALSYYYKGKKYRPADIGITAFGPISIDETDLSIDIYEGSLRLGNVSLDNVISWDGFGCLGQTYSIIKTLGLRDADFLPKLASLGVVNARISSTSARDYKIEEKIDKIIAAQQPAKKQDDFWNETSKVPATQNPTNPQPSSAIYITGNKTAANQSNTTSSSNAQNQTRQQQATTVNQNNTAEASERRKQEIRDYYEAQRKKQQQERENYEAQQRQKQEAENARRNQQSKENYEAQLKQSQAIENLRQDAYQSIENAVYGTPEQREANMLARRQARLTEEADAQRKEEERLEKRRIEKENRIREAEEARLREEENNRIEAENRRIEAERIEKCVNYYEVIIPAHTMPSKYNNADLTEVYYFYIIRTDKDKVSFSSLFPIRKSSDNSWPFKSDMDNKLKSATNAQEYKLVGFFTDQNTALSRQQELIQTAQQEGLTVNNFNFKFKDYKDAVQQTNSPAKPKESSDFWNK